MVMRKDIQCLEYVQNSGQLTAITQKLNQEIPKKHIKKYNSARTTESLNITEDIEKA